VNQRCAMAGCVNPPALYNVYCIGHLPRNENTTYYGPGDGNFEIETVEDKPPTITCRECPLCELLSLIPLCWYHFVDRCACDIWVCFACELRVGPNDKACLPDTLDMKFNTTEGWW
jgi:hypothetical protein